MQDAEAKVAFLASYADTVAEVAKALGSDHTARVYGRALLLATDSFLVFAPNVKHRAAAAQSLPAPEVSEVEDRLRRLRRDYEGHFVRVRDRVAAHQQELALDELIRVWNDVDASTLDILRDDMMEVSQAFERRGVLKVEARSPKLAADERLRAALAAVREPAGVRIGNDRLAITRGEVGIIPCDPTQEKAQRIMTAFEHIRLLSELPDELNEVFLAHKARWDLIIVELLGVLDNLFTDDPGNAQRPPDPSLLTLWQKYAFRGAATLDSFARDTSLEVRLRLIRNKASAHIDAQMLLKDIVALMRSVPAADSCAYVEAIYTVFRKACAEDGRTQFLLLHGQTLRGIVDVTDVGAKKPF